MACREAIDDKTDFASWGLLTGRLLDAFRYKTTCIFCRSSTGNYYPSIAAANKQAVKEIPKFPAVQRDLAMVVSTQLPYEEIENTVKKIKLEQIAGY